MPPYALVRPLRKTPALIGKSFHFGQLNHFSEPEELTVKLSETLWGS